MSALLPIMLVPVVWLLYLGPLHKLTPIFRNNQYFLKLWPSNPTYGANFLQGSYSVSEQSFFFAMTSTISLIWFFWSVWRIIHELRRKDRFYIPRWLPGFAILSPICVAGTYYNYFRVTESAVAPSLAEPMSIGILKVILNISIFYYMIAALLEQVLLYLRRDKTIPPFSS